MPPFEKNWYYSVHCKKYIAKEKNQWYQKATHFQEVKYLQEV